MEESHCSSSTENSDKQSLKNKDPLQQAQEVIFFTQND